MHKFILVLTVAIICLWTTQVAHGQESLQKLFTGKEIVAETTFDPQINKYKVFTTTNRIAVVATSKTSTTGEVHLYDNDGELLWQKEVEKLFRVSMAEESDKIIVISEWNLKDEQRNVCYDRNGNKLWETSITAPGLTQSKDGKYGITTQVSGEEWKGKFQIFDLKTGTEIPTPITKKHHHFYAQFLNERKVVILVQKVRVVRHIPDPEKLKELGRIRREGTSDQYREYENAIKRGIKSVEKLPLHFIIYDIPSQKVEIEKELVSTISGRNFHSDPDWSGNLTVSKNGQFIAIAGKNLPREERRTGRPYCILLMNIKGEPVWEKDDFIGIFDVSFVEPDILVAINGYTNKNIQLIDIPSGKRLWQHNIDRSGRSIHNAFVRNGKLIFQYTDGFRLEISSLLSFDLVTGTVYERIDDALILQRTKSKSVIFDKDNGTIKFIKLN